MHQKLKIALLLLCSNALIYSAYFRFELGAGYGGSYAEILGSNPKVTNTIHYIGVDSKFIVGKANYTNNTVHAVGFLFGLSIPILLPTKTTIGGLTLDLPTREIHFAMPLGFAYDFSYKKFLLHFNLAPATPILNYNLTLGTTPTAFGLSLSASLGFGFLITNVFSLNITYTGFGEYYLIGFNGGRTVSSVSPTLYVRHVVSLGLSFRFGVSSVKDRSSIYSKYLSNKKRESRQRNRKKNSRQNADRRESSRARKAQDKKINQLEAKNQELQKRVDTLEKDIQNEVSSQANSKVNKEVYKLKNQQLMQKAKDKMQKITQDLKNLRNDFY